jgi:hypothetical protein
MRPAVVLAVLESKDVVLAIEGTSQTKWKDAGERVLLEVPCSSPLRRSMGLSDEYEATCFYAYPRGLHLIHKSKISVGRKRSRFCPASSLRVMQEWAFSVVESHPRFEEVKPEFIPASPPKPMDP